jgi:uncharacterized protein YecE (DUF72 family)
VKAQFRIGTASWQEPEFIRDWYPKGLPKTKLLPWYAEHFNYVEVNGSFYGIPKASVVEQWCKQTPDDFLFDVKLHKLLSRHSTDAKFLPADLRTKATVAGGKVVLTSKMEKFVAHRFRDGIQPLIDAKKLGALLLQLSPSFRPKTARLSDLENIFGLFSDCELAVELRNRDWMEDGDSSPQPSPPDGKRGRTQNVSAPAEGGARHSVRAAPTSQERRAKDCPALPSNISSRREGADARTLSENISSPRDAGVGRGSGRGEKSQREETLAFFRKYKVTLVNVDAPQSEHFTAMPFSDEVTNPRLAYMRLHGRDEAAFVRGKTVADRFNYLYNEEELREIAAVAVNLGLKAENVHIVFNNNRSNYAPKSTEQLQRILEIYHEIKNVRPKIQQPELV